MKFKELISKEGFQVNIIIRNSKYFEEYLNYGLTANGCIAFWNLESDHELLCVVRNEDITPSNTSNIVLKGILPNKDDDKECMAELLETGKLINEEGEDETGIASLFYHLDVPIMIYFTKNVPATTDEVAADILIGKL